MTNWMGRRALLQSGTAMLSGAMMSGISSAQAQDSGAKTPYEFMVKDIVYQRSGGRARPMSAIGARADKNGFWPGTVCPLMTQIRQMA